MANSNQLRLQQISGSLGAMTPSGRTAGTAPGASLGATSIADMEDIMAYYAQALANIHGNLNFGAQTVGLIAHESGNVIVRGTDDNASQSVILGQADGTGSDAVKVSLAFDGSDDTNSTLKLENTRGDVDGSDDAGAIELSAAAGGIALAWADTKSLWAEGGDVMVVANEDKAAAIQLHADAGSSQTIVVLNDEGTSESAITLTSTAGGVDINAASGKDVDVTGGQVKLNAANDSSGVAGAISLSTGLSSQGGAADTVLVSNLQGTDHKSIKLEASTGGLLISGSAGGLQISGSAGASAQSYGIVLSASLGGNLGGHVRLAAGGGARMEITGSSIEFNTADSSSGGMAGGIMKFATSGEFAQFIAKDNFSSTTSIIGAFNALADSGEPTKFVQVITASVASAAGLVFGTTSLTDAGILNISGSAGGKKSGTANSLQVAEFHRMDVYLNGMLLLSGGKEDVLSGDGKNPADYTFTSAGQMKFGFDLAPDDVVQIIDRS